MSGRACPALSERAPMSAPLLVFRALTHSGWRWESHQRSTGHAGYARCDSRDCRDSHQVLSGCHATYPTSESCRSVSPPFLVKFRWEFAVASVGVKLVRRESRFLPVFHESRNCFKIFGGDRTHRRQGLDCGPYWAGASVAPVPTGNSTTRQIRHLVSSLGNWLHAV